MKILQVHNTYIGKTGEETVVEEEKKVLEANGHQVTQFIKDNAGLNTLSLSGKIKVYTSLTSSKAIANELRYLIDHKKPDICHVHNTFPLITPIVYQICKEKGIPVVQTLHNYKLVCTNSLLFKDGEVCELCLNKSLYNSIKYKCYRNSHVATAMQAHVIQFHRNKGTWANDIDRYICLTDFQKDKLISGGLDAKKIVVKPNFIQESGLNNMSEDFFLFVGKLDDYKGLQDLLYLFRNNSKTRFVLIGKSDRPEKFRPFKNVQYLGEQGRAMVLDQMSRCKAVLFPSKYYEGMPMVLLEAFSHKKPVISRDVGAMSSMVINNYNGIKYETQADLVIAVEKLENDTRFRNKLAENSYKEYLSKYTKAKGYKNLIDLYSNMISESKSKRSC